MTGPRPLAGLLVADFSRVVAGPYATMTLADLGADVIKVERPGTGDDTRDWGPPFLATAPAVDRGDTPRRHPAQAPAVDRGEAAAEPTSSYYLSVNRGKRSVCLDLAEPSDLDLALRLAARADVVVDNFKPGTMARFGLDHASLSATNPRVVTCSITGFGESGPGRELPGYDLLAQAASGLMHITGAPDGAPTKVGVAVIDILAALHATIGILAALDERHRTGRGRHVSVSLFETGLATLLNQGSAWLTAGEDPIRAGNDHPSIAPYSAFETGDGSIVIACGNDGQFRRLAVAVDRPGIADDDRFATNVARVANRDALRAEIEAALSAADSATWAERITRVGVPAGAINSVSQAFATAEGLRLDPIIDAQGTKSVRPPIRFDDHGIGSSSAPPALGAHDAEIRAWLEGD